jgi:hypothetical protein
LGRGAAAVSVRGARVVLLSKALRFWIWGLKEPTFMSCLAGVPHWEGRTRFSRVLGILEPKLLGKAILGPKALDFLLFASRA